MLKHPSPVSQGTPLSDAREGGGTAKAAESENRGLEKPSPEPQEGTCSGSSWKVQGFEQRNSILGPTWDPVLVLSLP